MTRHVVEVDEAVVKKLNAGRNWWESLRLSCVGTSRIRKVPGGGSRFQVACEDEVHASMLAGRLRREGVPASAVRVCEVRT